MSRSILSNKPKRINRERIVGMIASDLVERAKGGALHTNGEERPTDREEACIQYASESHEEAMRRLGYDPVKRFLDFISSKEKDGVHGRIAEIQAGSKRMAILLYPEMHEGRELSAECTNDKEICQAYGLDEFFLVSTGCKVGRQFLNGGAKPGAKVVVNACTGQTGKVVKIH